MGGDHARTPIIAMTANVMEEEVARFREAGMNDHIGKPFDPDELNALINRAAMAHSNAAAGAGGPAESLQVGAAPSSRPVLEESILVTLSTIVGREKTARLLRTFSLEAERRLAELETNGPSPDMLASQAHSLISLAGQLGFLELSELCSLIEEAALAGGGLDRITALREATDRAIAAAGMTAFAKIP